MTVSIPDWTTEGVLPPVDAGSPTSPSRSPYAVSLIDLVQRFGTSKERIEILDGFLNYRQGLHDAGLTQGFQWLDGSYLEHVEALESRSPNDIYVVSFIEFPEAISQLQIKDRYDEIIGLTRSTKLAIKRKYQVDAYLVSLALSPADLFAQTSYWYSMWSHRRNSTWKGFVQLPLSPDSRARHALEKMKYPGVTA
ncbi:MAG: hypothetical protein GYB17_00335 [Gammaproteobacteria bacterium]|nr:hypothetical protein [Gammaproteobacteria bacterium]